MLFLPAGHEFADFGFQVLQEALGGSCALEGRAEGRGDGDGGVGFGGLRPGARIGFGGLSRGEVGVPEGGKEVGDVAAGVGGVRVVV